MVLRKLNMRLKNEGAVARDHLANERTFLAWLRTSLGFASGGVAITQLIKIAHQLNQQTVKTSDNEILDEVMYLAWHFNQEKAEKYLGPSFVLAAIVILAVGLWRYFASQYWLLRDLFPAGRGSIITIFLISLLLIVASFGLVINVHS
ncbi:hypothetical protein NADFUDRAFT_82159 [Nadsonia fulvescens var. elongata DSM 6958]|uniref:DUF202 domain-containing protein n=1 Tax=Nadsonia fulvescens var. elongata DSM 6958 TaxID=857566 RepID=A0A1E3PLH8_9ASCO|nr:hypothetical protein NADFUDRAFT_82159 [Nadsonia fulvescens var. elongata DSM 6958]